MFISINGPYNHTSLVNTNIAWLVLRLREHRLEELEDVGGGFRLGKVSPGKHHTTRCHSCLHTIIPGWTKVVLAHIGDNKGIVMRLVLNLYCILPRLSICWLVMNPASSNQGLSAMFSLILLVLSLVVLASFGVGKAISTTVYDPAFVTPELVVFVTERITAVVLEFLSTPFIYTVLKHQVS